MTKQETDIKLKFVNSVNKKDKELIATYGDVNPKNVEFEFNKTKGEEKTLFDL